MRNDLQAQVSPANSFTNPLVAATRWLGRMILAGMSARAGAVVAIRPIDRRY